MMKLYGRPRHKCEDNIKTDRREINCGDVYWIELPYDGA